MADPRRDAEPEDWIAPLADLDPLTGALPTELHHRQTRGAHPELKHTADNLIGVSHATHRLHHDTGCEIPQGPSLFDMF